jgi:uncharacterized protein
MKDKRFIYDFFTNFNFKLQLFMLLEFSIGNFMSIKDIETIRFVATSVVSKDKEVDANNVFQATPKIKLLKTLAIYGANASGKSNFIKAMTVFKSILQNSIRETELLKHAIQNFALSTETTDKPTYFQTFFQLNGRIYRYGFEATNQEIVSEWLFATPNEREVTYFKRSFQKVEINKKQFPEAHKLQALLLDKNPVFRKNALLLTTLAAFNNQLADAIVQYWVNIFIFSGLGDVQMRNLADFLLFSYSEELLPKTLQLLQTADIGLSDIQIVSATKDHEGVGVQMNKLLASEHPKKMERVYKLMEEVVTGKYPKKVLTYHPKFDEEKQALAEKVAFDLDVQGSEGTKKLYEMSCYLLNALQTGGILIMDEFDARLHPKLSKKIIELFNDPNTNPKNAQLLVVTHDTNLLSAQLFRRDQILFVEKDKYGASHCYVLAQFKGVRNDASFETDYLMGRYGAVPALNDFITLFETQK